MMDLAYNENAVRTCERTAIFIGDDTMNIFEEVKVPNTYKTCITHRL